MKQINSVLDLRIGSVVYNQFTGRYGTVSDIRETAPEWLVATVRWHATECEGAQEEQLQPGPHIRLVDGAA